MEMALLLWLTVAILGGCKPVKFVENAKVGPIQDGKLNNVFMISTILGGISYQSLMNLWKQKRDCPFGVNLNSTQNKSVFMPSGLCLFMQNGFDEQF